MFKINSNVLKLLLESYQYLFVIVFLLCATAAYGKEPLHVEVGIKVQQITSINQREENFTAVASLLMKWHEPALQLNSDKAKGPRVYQVSKFISLMNEKKILWPAITFYNVQGRIAYQNQIVVVDTVGNVTYLARFTATFQAPDFNFRNFPLDHQTFHIKLDSILPDNLVRLQALENYSNIGDSLGEEEWILTNVKEDISTHSEFGFESSRFILSFEGERHLTYYFVRIFLPIIVIILVSWFSFFLKDYTKRIDLASGNLLLFIAFSFTIASDLPRLGYLTLMDTFLIATFVITGLVVLANVILKRLQGDKRDILIDKIDTIGLWGYPIFYIASGALMLILFYVL